MKKHITLLLILIAQFTLFSQTKIYKGDSNGSTFDCVYTYEDGKLYEGDSTSVFDLLYTIKGFVSLSQIAGLLLLV